MISTRKSINAIKHIALAGCASIAITQGAVFADSRDVDFDIKSQELSAALNAYGQQSDQEVFFIGSEMAGFLVQGLEGFYDKETALRTLLEYTGIHYKVNQLGIVLIGSAANAPAPGFQKISYNTNADFEAELGAYDADERADEADEFSLDEIIVTSSRRAQKLQDVPMSIASVNPDDFIGIGLTSLEDIIDYVPGVNFNGGSQAGQGNITIRAVSQESFIPVTAIYVDDVPLTTSTPFAFGANVFLDGLLGDLERVEVIKGPQGTLYGASAMGGIIRYITKDPALEEMRGNVSADVSTTKEGGITQLYRGTISTPIIEDKLGITVSGFYNEKAGYIDRLDPVTLTLADDDYNTSEIYGISVTALLKLSENASLRVSGMYQNTQAYGGNSVQFDVADPDNIVLVPQLGDYEIAAPDPGFNNLEYKKADATFKYAFDWGEFTSVTGYAQHINPALTDPIIAFGAVIDFISGSPPGTTTSIPVLATAESEKFIQEFRLSSLNNDTFEWQVGLFYPKDETNNVQLAIAKPQELVLNDSQFPSEYEEKAVFANATYYVTPYFDITAGFRYSEPSLDADFNFGGLLITPLVGQFSASENVTTYLFNARWRVEDALSLYARVASGYRPAYTNTPVTDTITGQTTSSIVNSDSLWSYEVGAKGSVLDGKFSYDIALWTMQWEDFQAGIQLNGLGTSANAGVGQSSHGFEGTFNAFVTDKLLVQATVAYTKSTLDEDSVTLGGVARERTRGLPDWTASLLANYTYTIGDIDAAVGLGVRYIGELNGPYLGDPTRGIGFGLNRQFSFGEVLLTDLNASFTWDDLTLRLYATNLFDAYDFISGGIRLDGLGNTTAGASVAKPRTIGASVAFSF